MSARHVPYDLPVRYAEVAVDPLERVQIGDRGIWVSRLGLGMAAFGNAARTSDEDAAATLAAVASLGLGFVDVASEYGLGLAERRLATSLPDLTGRGVTITVKVGRRIRPATRRARILHTFEESVSSRAGMRRLGRKMERVSRAAFGRVPGAGSGNGPSPASAGSAGAGVASAQARGRRDLAREPAAVCAYSYDGVMRSFEESLARIGTDHVGMAFIHEPELHVGEASSGGYRALEQLRASGAVDGIGVAMSDPDSLLTFADRGDYDCFMLGGRYTLLEQPALNRLLPAAEARGIAILLGAPFNSGILADPRPGARYDHRPADRRRLERAARIAAVCERHDVPLKAAALQFPFGHPAVAAVVVGAANAAELEEDAALLRTPIPAALWEELRMTGLVHRDAPVPDAAPGGAAELAPA